MSKRHEFLTWEPGWKLYLSKEFLGADGETKLEFLRKAWASTSLALDVISGFIAEDGQYEDCMEMIWNVYNIPWVHAERYVQQLQGMVSYPDKESSATMRKIRDNEITKAKQSASTSIVHVYSPGIVAKEQSGLYDQ